MARTKTKVTYAPLDESDWREVYNTFQVVREDNLEWERANRKLNRLLGIDGRNVKLDKLTPKILREWAEGVYSKAAALRRGLYDDYVGEIDACESETREWAEQMERIAATLREMANERMKEQATKKKPARK